MEKLKVVFIGTGEFGVKTLQKLLKDERFEIPLIITGVDKPAGRKLKLQNSPVKEAAILNKLIVQQPGRVAEVKQKLIQIKPDFLLVVSYGEIIPSNILGIPCLGAINIHASLLPLYRGASPVQEALLRGDKKTGVTWILMNNTMDSGDIIAQKENVIDPNDNFPTLYEKLASVAAEETPGILYDFSQTQRATAQDKARATYCRKIKKEDGKIDVRRETAEEVLRKIKAYTPWPGVFLFINGKRIKITQATAGEQKMSSGEVAVTDSKSLAVGTHKGVLLPTRVQPESKCEMSIEEYLRGQKNEIPSAYAGGLL